MADLSVKYLGLDLANPVIIGSSPLTSNIDNLVKCQKAGCGAVVLKSIFEEQIEERIEGEVAANEQYLAHSDSVEAYEAISRNYYINNYLELLRKAKKELSIPVIASVNCIDLASWVDYVAAFEDAGCDALELNYYPIASDSSTEGSDVDARLEAESLELLVAQAEVLELVDGIRCVAYELAQEDLPIGIERVDDEVQQVAHFRLELFLSHCVHPQNGVLVFREAKILRRRPKGKRRKFCTEWGTIAYTWHEQRKAIPQ